jgi:hypothetical protein
MSLREVAQEGAYSVLIAPQTDLNTEGSSWEVIEAAVFVAEPVSTQAAGTMRGVAQYGGRRGPLAGRTWHNITLKGPVKGQLTAYALASDTPIARGLSRVLDFIGTGVNLAYQLNGVGPDSPAADRVVVLTTAAGKYGCLLASTPNGGSATKLGFIKDLTGAGPYDCTVLNDMLTQPAANEERLPTRNIYPSAAALTNVALTIRCVFDHASQDYRWIGWVPTGATRLVVEDDTLMWEIPGIAYGGTNHDEAGGGLQALTGHLPMAPVVEASYHILQTAAGTDYGPVGIRDVALSLDFGDPIRFGGPKPQGVGEAVTRMPVASATVSIPRVSDFIVGGRDILTAAYEDDAAISICGYHGDTPGALLAWAIRGGKVSERPREAFVDGVLHVTATIVADEWTGDTAATDCGDKPLVISLG